MERLESFGRAVLSAVDALDTAPDVPQAMQTGLLLAHKTMPAWALRLLVLRCCCRHCSPPPTVSRARAGGACKVGRWTRGR